jgi:hypothetical protein
MSGKLPRGQFERAERDETVEIANIHAVVTDVNEKIVGYEKRQGEYATVAPASALSKPPRSADAPLVLLVRSHVKTQVLPIRAKLTQEIA